VEEPIPVKIPLLNPNEPEALVTALYVSEGQQVAAGEVLCALETTKSAAELSAEADGYIAGLRLAQGQTARAGEILCYLAPSPGWSPPEPAPGQGSIGEDGTPAVSDLPAGLRITQPALALARRSGLDLGLLPAGPLITESAVQEKLRLAGSPSPGPDFYPPASAFDPTAILIYGGGGHGKMVADLLSSLGLYRPVGFVDDGLPAGVQVLGLPVLGGSEILESLYERGARLAVNAVGGIGNIGVRIKVFRRLAEAGFVFPTLVHTSAVVERSARLAAGAQVFACAYVGSEASVGFGAIVNTGAILSHDCKLGEYVNISPGAILAGAVEIGSGALVGMGATINLEVKIGAGARIGNGATVKADVPAGGIVRAGAIWPE
jgi:sugar O-acyltransferase (sialic acid O-acetyltransferase NeuD family)